MRDYLDVDVQKRDRERGRVTERDRDREKERERREERRVSVQSPFWPQTCYIDLPTSPFNRVLKSWKGVGARAR